MLVDLKHVIVQIFSQEGRDKFQLEAHWRSQSNAALALGQAVPTDPLSSDDPG
jgi:ribosomal silencing factor RsfS